MPCSSDGYPTHEELQREKLDLTTRLLCSVCKNLENIYEKTEQSRRGLGREILQQVGIILKDHELNSWWIKHKKIDEERIAREIAEAVKTEAKRVALAKLSNEDKQVLGLR